MKDLISKILALWLTGIDIPRSLFCPMMSWCITVFISIALSFPSNLSPTHLFDTMLKNQKLKKYVLHWLYLTSCCGTNYNPFWYIFLLCPDLHLLLQYVSINVNFSKFFWFILHFIKFLLWYYRLIYMWSTWRNFAKVFTIFNLRCDRMGKITTGIFYK